jgi:osmoprotectant transport system ATP-binding protein
MSHPPAIVADNVSKQFPNTAQSAVDRCSFTVEPGQFIVLLGPSGCGKTTLLKMINRLYEPSGGRILVHGEDIQSLPVTQLRRRIGYVIQQTGLFPHMRIEDNIAVVPRLVGWPGDRISARIDDLLDLIGLPRDYRRRYPRQLSGGEQQRVGIARALAADPALMLMDEPFGAIDAITRSRLQDELLQIQRKLHKTIMFVTHDVEEALRLADRIIIMRAGRIVQFDSPLRILTHPADDFVAQLVDAGDVLRHLSLVRVGTVAAPLDPAAMTHADDSPRIAADADMRAALSLLVSTGAEALAVVDQDDRPIGRIDFARVQRATSEADRQLAADHEQREARQA